MERMTRVLLVEDHRVFSAGLAYLLNLEPDMEILGAAHSARECRAYMESGECFDVAIVDLYLPDAEGIDLVGELREFCPDSAVVVLTISLDEDDWRRAEEAGANKVLSKAADPDEIVAAIRRIGKVER